MKVSHTASDFFKRQENARRATRSLVLWFTFGLAGTAAAIYAIIRLALTFIHYGNITFIHFPEWNEYVPALAVNEESYWWDPVLILIALIGVIVIVGGASFVKIIESAGMSGSDVAQELGGRAISPSSSAPDERKLINVVQEMSLASGVPVPKIFILEDEKSINAFAAGASIDRAAIAVSRGALDKLTRDELQAVIGHEYSHILNGDMRLNIRLVGWIFGLVMISIIGQTVFRLAAFQPRSRNRENGGAALLLLAVGGGLLIIGAVSQVFAQIIQAAISRKREHLADASATQFTRNPVALANALSRIGGDSYGSTINSPRAGEYAHLFFANGVHSLFSTHPPLEERIRALNPEWNGKFLPPLNCPEKNTEDIRAAQTHGTNLNKLNQAFSRSSIPAFIEDLSQTPSDAKALIYMLLMTDSPAHNVEQAKILLSRECQGVFKKMEKLWGHMQNFPREKRISGVLLAAPALREMHARERSDFCTTLTLLAEADGKISLYEFCILTAVKGVLIFRDTKNLSANEIIPETELVLNLFLRESACSQERRGQVLEAALSDCRILPKTLRVINERTMTLPSLEAAFEKLRDADIMVKQELIDAAKFIVSEDGKISETEADLVKTFAVALGCPMPKI